MRPSQTLDLSIRFPLTVAGAEALADLDEAPEPPIPQEGSELAAWQRMPLSKRRLAVCGALEAGTSAAMLTATIIAAEARAQGIPYAVAEKLACAVVFTTASTPSHRVKRQLRNAAKWAFNPTDGQPILTGCCRDPRQRDTTGLKSPNRLRSLMAPYCDGACAASCPMLAAIRFPQQALIETEYAAIASSSIFQRGGGLGEAGRLAYEQLALAARLDPQRRVTMSASYLALKTEGQFTREAFSKKLRSLHDLGLAPIVSLDETKTPLRFVPVLGRDEIRELEMKLGVAGQRNRNMTDARRNTERRQDWLLENVASNAEKIEAWTL